jgi:tight adherence protein B
MRRICLLLVATLALALAATASASVKIAGVDKAGYPQLRLTIVTSQPSSREPLIRENGQPIQGSEADNLGQCANVVLAIDRSQSMRGKALRDAAAAANSFVLTKPGCTRVEIVAFGHRATELTGMSSSTIDAQYELRTIEVDAKEGTALWDAVATSARALDKQASGGRVLIVLTDGADTARATSLEQAIAAAHAAGVAAYPIGIESDQFKPDALQRLARDTGGSYHAASGTDSLQQVYASIRRELARTWRVSYPTAARPGETPKLDASIPGLGADQKAVFLPPALGASLAPEQPDPIVPAQAYDHGFGTLVLMIIVGIATLAAFSLILSAPRSKRLRRRIEPHVDARAQRRKEQRQRFGATRALMGATEKAFVRFSVWERLQRLLERADMPLRAVELFYICAACAFVPAFIAAFAGAPSFLLLLMMGGGAAAPIGFVWFKAKKRLQQIDDSLADLLITLAASLKAGHSFRQGLAAAAEENSGPLTKELKRVLTETSLGRPMDDALQEMADRIGSKDLSFVITAVTIQRQVGGSLAGIFDLVADTIRQRQQFARKIRGLTAMGRASMWVLIALPIALAMLLTLINATYMHPLWFTNTGHYLLYTGTGMIVFGYLALRRIVNFKG